MSPARLRLLQQIAAHEADYAARRAAGLVASWETSVYRPRGMRGFAAAANSAERAGLVIVYRSGRDRSVDGAVLTAAGRDALKAG